MQTCVNNYILRIYRIDRKDPQHLMGLVEEVGGKEKKPFTNVRELLDILSHPKRTPAADKGNKIKVQHNGGIEIKNL